MTDDSWESPFYIGKKVKVGEKVIVIDSYYRDAFVHTTPYSFYQRWRRVFFVLVYKVKGVVKYIWRIV